MRKDELISLLFAAIVLIGAVAICINFLLH